MADLRVELFDGLTLLGRRRFYFRGVDPDNNEIEYPSQAYKDRRSRDKTAIKLAVAFGTVPVDSKR